MTAGTLLVQKIHGGFDRLVWIQHPLADYRNIEANFAQVKPLALVGFKL